MNMQPTPSASPGDRVGQLVSGRYRIIALLGEGGMGAVYVVEHTLMRKRFALKLLHPELAQNEEVMARFRREAEAAAHLDHPNVVAATDFGRMEDGGFFLVLEYVDGTSLRDVLVDAPFPTARALWIARQIAVALDRAHRAGIVHRDLKPENVMLVRKDEDADFVKVLDFGIARIEPQNDRDARAQPLTRIGTVMGTPEYMAPEQALGESVNARADLYALGVVLYEMLTARHPFDGDTMSMLSLHVIAPVPAMGDRAPHVAVPPPVEAVVRRLLEKDSGARYASARALVDAIDEAALASGIELPVAARSSDRMSIAGPSSSNRVSVVVTSPGRPRPATTSRQVLAPTVIELPAAEAPSQQNETLARRARVQVETLVGALERATKLPRRTVVVLLASVPVFVVLVSIAGVLLVRRDVVPSRDDGNVTVSERTAPPEKIRAAAAKGPAALEALAAEYPADRAVSRELAFAYDKAGRTTEALAAVRRLSDAGAEAVPRDVVRLVMRAASQLDTADQAFELLEERLGAAGVDALLDLVEDKEAPERTRTRAWKSLAKPRVRARATRAAAFLIDLSGATTCEAKREVLVRSADDADSRALTALRALKSTRGCGRGGRHDCHPCLRTDDSLDRALRAAEAGDHR